MEDFKAAYLEDWMDTIEALPCELQRSFSLICQLDAQSQDVLRNVDASSREFMEKARQCSVEERKQMLRSLTQTFKKATQHSEDKVSLSMQTYDLIDRHIRRLDADLLKFEEELTMTGPSTNPQFFTSPAGYQQGHRLAQQSGSRSANDSPAKKRKTAVAVGQQPGSSSRRSARSASFSNDARPDVAIANNNNNNSSENLGKIADPSEPTYCICGSVSYGEMIACDNPDCDIEWFHYDCVGLDSPPKGKWYCDQCKSKYGY